MKPSEQQQQKSKTTTNEYDVDSKRAKDGKTRIREDVEHDPIDTETGTYAKRDGSEKPKAN